MENYPACHQVFFYIEVGWFNFWSGVLVHANSRRDLLLQLNWFHVRVRLTKNLPVVHCYDWARTCPKSVRSVLMRMDESSAYWWCMVLSLSILPMKTRQKVGRICKQMNVGSWPGPSLSSSVVGPKNIR